MKDLFIFDLDGTLIDTLKDLATAVNYALKGHGYAAHNVSEYRYFVGDGVKKLVERALPENAREEKIVMQVLEHFRKYYGEHKTDFTAPYPGIKELLCKLHHSGKILAVASNKYQSATVALVEHYFGREIFSIIYGQREGIPVKPHPIIVQTILHDAESEPHQAIYIGDSNNDMLTAKAAGVESIGVTWGFRDRDELEENGATYIVDIPDEILKFV